MNIQRVIEQKRQQIQKLKSEVDVLEGILHEQSVRAQPKGKTGIKRKGRTFTVAQREAQAEHMKRYWADRKQKEAKPEN